MWRSIASRSYLSRTNLPKKFSSLHNSQSQVTHKPLNSSSSYYYLSILQQPRKFSHLNQRFFSQSSSSITDFEHDPTSSEELDLENNINGGFKVNDTHVDKSSLEVGLASGFDSISENNDAQMSVLSSNDDKFDVEKLGENGGFMVNDTHVDKSSLDVGLGSDFDSVSENNDAQMNVSVSNDEKFEEIDVEKLENVLSLLQSSVDESLETILDKLDLNLNEEFVIKVLETPLVPGNHLVRFFNWVLGKNVVEVNAVVLSTLLRAVCNDPGVRRKDVYALWDTVKEFGVKESGVVNVEMLNLLILVFSKLGKGKAAFEVFGKVEEFGCVPNVDTYYLTFEALSKRSFYDWAISVCQKMLDAGMIPENDKVGKIISFFCKDYRSKEAYAVYLAAKKQNRYPPQQAVDFLISCLSKEDETVNLAREMLDDIPDEVRKHSINSFSWVTRGLCRTDIEGAKKLLAEMIEKGPPPGNIVFNSIINSLSKAGELEDAKEMLKLIESRGLRPDVFSYSVIISGYVKGGMMDEACKVLSMAKEKHSKLCSATLHSLIRGYCNLGEYEKALKLFGEMKDYGVEPTVDEYNKLIQSLCLKALDWKTAEKLLEEMKEKGLYLPGITRGLISAVKELELEAVASEDAAAEPL